MSKTTRDYEEASMRLILQEIAETLCALGISRRQAAEAFNTALSKTGPWPDRQQHADQVELADDPNTVAYVIGETTAQLELPSEEAWPQTHKLGLQQGYQDARRAIAEGYHDRAAWIRKHGLADDAEVYAAVWEREAQAIEGGEFLASPDQVEEKGKGNTAKCAQGTASISSVSLDLSRRLVCAQAMYEVSYASQLSELERQAWLDFWGDIRDGVRAWGTAENLMADLNLGQAEAECSS